MIIGTCGALLLNAALPGRSLFRLMTMPPWIVPMAIGIFMWGWMYNGQFGMISGLLQRFGIVDGPIAAVLILAACGTSQRRLDTVRVGRRPQTVLGAEQCALVRLAGLARGT